MKSAIAAPLAALLALAVAAPLPAGAAVLKLSDKPYSYTVIDQDLSAALQEFGSNVGIKVNISPEVKGRIQGRMPEGTAQAFLDRLATHILAYEGDSHWEWFEGNFEDYEQDKIRRLGPESVNPKRVTYKRLTR